VAKPRIFAAGCCVRAPSCARNATLPLWVIAKMHVVRVFAGPSRLWRPGIAGARDQRTRDGHRKPEGFHAQAAQVVLHGRALRRYTHMFFPELSFRWERTTSARPVVRGAVPAAPKIGPPRIAMIIVLKPHATPEVVEHVLERITALGFTPHLSQGVARKG
jgi:hypothetical protein